MVMLGFHINLMTFKSVAFEGRRGFLILKVEHCFARRQTEQLYQL